MINKFKLARAISGKTQLQISFEAKMNITTLSLIEDGYRKPNPEQLAKLEAVLPLRKAELVTGKR